MGSGLSNKARVVSSPRSKLPSRAYSDPGMKFSMMRPRSWASRSSRVRIAADLPQYGVRRLLWPVEMQRHDGSEAPRRRQLMAVVGRRHDLHAQLFRGRQKIVVAVAGGGQQQQDALH